MTIEEFNTSLANLIVQKDSLNAQYTNLIQAIGQHAQALVEYEQSLTGESEEEGEATPQETDA